MKRTICKITIFLLLLSAFVTSFSSCARESDEEFLTLTAELLQKSAAVNEICFGEGLAYDEQNGYATSGYAEATEESCLKYGVRTVEEIKALVASVYSVAVADYIDDVVFQPVKDGNTFLTYRRYFDAMDGEGNVALMVKKDYEVKAHGTVTYGNLRVETHARTRATVLTDVSVTDGENSRVYENVSFDLRFEDGAWKLDTVTYASLT